MVWAPLERIGFNSWNRRPLPAPPAREAVQRAGVQMGETEMLRQPLGQGALAARSGAVDGDDNRL